MTADERSKTAHVDDEFGSVAPCRRRSSNIRREQAQIFFRVPCHLSHIPLNWLGRSLTLPLNVNADTTLQLVGASRKLAKVHRQRL